MIVLIPDTRHGYSLNGGQQIGLAATGTIPGWFSLLDHPGSGRDGSPEIHQDQ